jgi:hypothetical protein
VIAALLSVGLLIAVAPQSQAAQGLAAPTGAKLTLSGHDFVISWDPYSYPSGTRAQAIEIQRNGVTIASVPAPATSYNVGPTCGSVYTIRAAALRGVGNNPPNPMYSDWVTVPSGPMPRFQVGVATRSINPNAQVAPPDGQVYMGGFGLGAGRRSVGILGSGASVRAFVVGNATDAIAIVESDSQGAFAAYDAERGNVGLLDMEQAAQQATGGALKADHILIASDHSHAGQDLIGVWGGVPASYLDYVKTQTVAAITAAYQNRVCADLSVGSIGGIISADNTPILTSQFDDSSCTSAPTPDDPGHTTLPCSDPTDYPQWDLVDNSVRVLKATAPGGSIVGVLVNFAAHSTVMGSGNRLISSDWPGVTAEKLSARLNGAPVVVLPAANGRTQPERPGGADPDKLDAYATTVTDVAQRALSTTVPVQGEQIAAKKRYITENATNAGILALLYAGEQGCNFDPNICVPIMRAKTPPWQSGTVIGTVASAFRIGDVLLSGTPGEPYPQIAFGIQNTVAAGRSAPADISHYFLFSLADDQLGYLISPSEGVPFAAVKTAVDGNDNWLFNISPTIGDHVMCSDISLAQEVGFATHDVDQRCAAWSAEPDTNPYTMQPNQ